MDKEYLYLRVRTDSSVQQTPNPKEKYVLIYPVVQEDEDNNINMSIHLKDHLGNTHKVSGSTQKINLLQNQLDTLQGDLISILQEILGYTDTSESSSSMSSDILQPIGFVLTGCDIHAINGQYYYTVSDNGTVVSYDKRIEESEMYVKIYYDEDFNNGCWVIYNENTGGVECYNSSLNSDATIQQVAQCEWQSYDSAVETPPSFDRFIYDSIGGSESSDSSQSSSSVGQIEQYIPMGSGTWEDPYNWYGVGFMSDDYPENVTISFENNKGVMSRNDYDNGEYSESALIAVYLEEDTQYSIEIYDINYINQIDYTDPCLYILGSNKEFLLWADDRQSGGGFTYEIQHSDVATAAYFQPDVTGKYYIEVASLAGSIYTAKVAVTPAPLKVSLTSPITD